MTLPPGDCWVSINGRLCTAEQAVVSVFDHGFLYGDSVYEAVRTFGRRPFLWEPHLVRLRQSGARLMLPSDFSDAEVTRQLYRVLEQRPEGESLVRVIWTRGTGDVGYDIHPDQHPTLIVLARGLKENPAAYYEEGIPVRVVGVRRNAVMALDPRVKTSNVLNLRLAYLEARREGAVEALLLSNDGNLAEGSGTNVFVVQGGTVKTATLTTGVLPGITRRLALHLASRLGIETSEEVLPGDVLMEADEVFVTSTTKGIMPVRQVDDRVLGSPGPVTRRLMEGFQQFVASGEWVLPE